MWFLLTCCVSVAPHPRRPLFVVDTFLARLVGPQSFDRKSTTIVDMDNQTILKVLPNNQKALIKQATEEFRE
jgi:hypothetical protein